jgi:hypothetical protein
MEEILFEAPKKAIVRGFAIEKSGLSLIEFNIDTHPIAFLEFEPKNGCERWMLGERASTVNPGTISQAEFFIIQFLDNKPLGGLAFLLKRGPGQVLGKIERKDGIWV